MEIFFIWDEHKAKRNFQKHGVTFEEASSVLKDTLSLTVPDVLHDFKEERFITVGQSYHSRILVVVHCDQGGFIRLISARLATPRERKDYETGC